MVSGRGGFELAQKAVAAGIAAMASALPLQAWRLRLRVS